MNHEGLMDETDFNLYELADSILCKWYWIAIGLVVTAGVTFFVSSLLPKIYRASASVLLTEPAMVFEFDPRIQTQVEMPGSDGVPDLAFSDGMIKTVLDEAIAARIAPKGTSVSEVLAMAEVELSYPLIILSVSNEDPSLAASLANLWAEVLTRKMNTLYAPSTQSQEVLISQAAEAQKAWYSAQDTLIENQSENRERVVVQEIAALEQTIATLLDLGRRFDLTLRDADLLLTKLDALPPSSQTGLREDLTALILTIRALSSTTDVSSSPVGVSEEDTLSFVFSEVSTESLMLNLVIDGNDLLDESVQTQIDDLEVFITAIKANKAVLDQEISIPESMLIERQWELAQLQEQRIRLEQDRNLSLEAYQTLTRVVQESEIASQGQEVVARVASQAIPPTQADSPKIIINTILGAIMGALLGLAWILISSWWEGESTANKAQ